jgi:hypothetical protein
MPATKWGATLDGRLVETPSTLEEVMARTTETKVSTRVWVAVALSVALTANLCLPWAMSARRLGVGDSAIVDWMLIGFLIIPVLTASAWVLASVGRERLTASTCLVPAAVAIVSTIGVARSPLEARLNINRRIEESLAPRCRADCPARRCHRRRLRSRRQRHRQWRSLKP